MSRHCSKFTIFHYNDEASGIRFRGLKKIHTQECPCHMNHAYHNDLVGYDKSRGADDNDVVFQIGSQARDQLCDGISLRYDDALSTDVDIPFDQLQYHKVSKLPWFWPWYHFNDITLLVQTHFQDFSYNLDMRLVFAKRKVYKNEYCFEFQVNKLY
jgi:hypothetical protein